MRRVTLACLVVSCARPTIAELKDRSVTLLLVERANTLCGQTFAIDHDGQAWFERGCENGVPKLKPTRSVAAAERDALAAAFATLDDSACAEAPEPQFDSEGYLTTFTLKQTTGIRIVRGCVVTAADGRKLLVPPARALLDRVTRAAAP